MQIFLIVLTGWLFIYWLPNLILLIYLVHKEQDINIEDLLAMIVVTALLGPIVGGRTLFEHCQTNKLLDKVVIKKCTKKEVWKALGGDERNGP